MKGNSMKNDGMDNLNSKLEYEIEAKVETIDLESIDETKLTEITDENIKGQINNLIFNSIQAGNTVNKVINSMHNKGQVVYRAVLPTGQQLKKSKTMEGAVRGIYGANGIEGHANFVQVDLQNNAQNIANAVNGTMNIASMVVGQYYMAQINNELKSIDGKISLIAEFQNNEFYAKVSSLILQIKHMACYQFEILEDNEIRNENIILLNQLKNDCTICLGQTNKSLNDCLNRESSSFSEYEQEIKNVQKWYEYQNLLLDILAAISELEYTLHCGKQSREQCNSIFLNYLEMAKETDKNLKKWHDVNVKEFDIDFSKNTRKTPMIQKIVFFGFNIFSPAFTKFKRTKIDKDTTELISHQLESRKRIVDASKLYDSDVQIVSVGDKLYYLPK